MDLVSAFNSALSEFSAVASSNPSKFTKSESAVIPRLNMNSRDNQGNIIFIPVAADPLPYFTAEMYECTSFWGGEKAGQRTTRMISNNRYYGEGTLDQISRYNTIAAKFRSVYQNVPMLMNTDWKNDVKVQKYFGIYGFVVSHTNTDQLPVKDDAGNTHAGKLYYIQFKSSAFIKAFETFINTMTRTQGDPSVWCSRLFATLDGNPARDSALSIDYKLATNQWTCSVNEMFFANQLPAFVNDAVNHPGKFVLPQGFAKKEDLNLVHSMLGIKLNPGDSLYNDPHLTDFDNAIECVCKSFDYFNAHGADAYSKWSSEFGWSLPANSAAPAGPAVATLGSPVPPGTSQPLSTPSTESLPIPGVVPGVQVAGQPVGTTNNPLLATPQPQVAPQAPQMPQQPQVAPQQPTMSQIPGVVIPGTGTEPAQTPNPSPAAPPAWGPQVQM